MKKVTILLVIPLLLSYTAPSKWTGYENRKVIFGLFEQGKMIEPIAFVNDGELVPALDQMELPAFAEQYYKPGTVYSVVSGGKLTGKTTVIKNDPASECGPMMADVKTVSPLLKFTTNELSLATDFKPAKTTAGLRRAATTTEKAAIEKLVRAAFNKKTILVKDLKQLRLTVLDIDNDKVPEIIGTYRCSPKVKERAAIFFIAAKNKTGAYKFQHSEIDEIREEDVMSGDITHVDDGIYAEKLLDILDINNDGKAEIFTTNPSFEGVGFNVYQLNGTAWETILDFSNYHCAY